MVALFVLLLICLASAASAKKKHPLSSRIPNVIAVRVRRSFSCAKKVSTALKAAGCKFVLRTDVQTNLASMCSFEVLNSCSYTSVISQSEGFLRSFSVSGIDRPEPVDTTAATATRAFDPSPDAIHSTTGVLDARYKLGLNGEGIKLAIIDTGVYYLHPALGGGFGPGFKVAFGYDLVGDNYDGTSASIVPDNDPLDNCSSESHGTHVAGIVAANATNITVPGFVPDFPFTGVAPGVTLGAYRIFSCSYPSVSDDIIAAAILRAAQDGADIINLSLGGLGYSDSVQAVAAQIVGQAGHIVVAAIGNIGAYGAFIPSVPAISSGSLGIASFDNVNTPSLQTQLQVDGAAFPFTLGINNGNFAFNVPYDGSFVANNPNAAANHVLDDGCTSMSVNVTGKAVLLFWGVPFACGSAARCNNAAAAGAAACILYYEKDELGSFPNGGRFAGSSLIPSLLTTLSAGEAIIKDLAANKTSIVVPIRAYTIKESFTGGALSSFSSPGLTNELWLKPDLGGIGGSVYSTISPFAATQKLIPPYQAKSGTSMASPYVAGCVALLLQKRGKIGFDAARTFLQNTATVSNIYNTSLVHSPAYQGAGLVNIYNAATTQTVVTPSSLSLNDTANRKRSEAIQIKNNFGSAVGPVTYRLTHIPAATANTFNSGDEFVLDQNTTTFNTNKVATLKFRNSGSSKYSITVKPGKSVTVRLEIFAPRPSSSHPLPLFGGYIAITNSVDSIVTRVPYAGVAGVWKNRDIWARNSTSLYRRWALGSPLGPTKLFGVTPKSTGAGLYADTTFTPLTTLQVVNASENGFLLDPFASDTRSFNVTIKYLCNNDASFKALGIQRTNIVRVFDLSRGSGVTALAGSNVIRDSYTSPLVYGFNGTVLGPKGLTSLPAGVYQITFSAWKNFGNENDVDVITTPPFQLIYTTALSNKTLADCQI